MIEYIFNLHGFMIPFKTQLKLILKAIALRQSIKPY